MTRATCKKSLDQFFKGLPFAGLGEHTDTDGDRLRTTGPAILGYSFATFLTNVLYQVVVVRIIPRKQTTRPGLLKRSTSDG